MHAYQEFRRRDLHLDDNGDLIATIGGSVARVARVEPGPPLTFERTAQPMTPATKPAPPVPPWAKQRRHRAPLPGR